MLRPLAQTGHDPSTRWGTTRDLAARGARPAALDLPAPALRPGHQPRDRPSPRAPRHVRSHAARSPAARAGRRRATARADRAPASCSTRRGSTRSRRSGSTRRSASEPLARALDRLVALAESAVGPAPRSSACPTATRAESGLPGAGLLALSAVHTRLVESGLRALPVSSSSPTSRATPTRSPALLGYGADAICPGWRSRRSRGWPRTTRSAATVRRRTRRSAASWAHSRRACSRSCPRWGSPTWPATAAPGSSKPSASIETSAGTSSAARRRRSAARARPVRARGARPPPGLRRRSGPSSRTRATTSSGRAVSRTRRIPTSSPPCRGGLRRPRAAHGGARKAAPTSMTASRSS